VLNLKADSRRGEGCLLLEGGSQASGQQISARGKRRLMKPG